MKLYIVDKTKFNNFYESIKGMVFYKNIPNDPNNIHVKFGCNKYENIVKDYLKDNFDNIFKLVD